MNCPRCQVELEDGHCPKCNWSISTTVSSERKEEQKGSEESSQTPEQESVAFTMEMSSIPPLPATGDWRAELKKKLDRHYQRKAGSDEPPRRSPKKAERDTASARARPAKPAHKAADKPPDATPESNKQASKVTDGQRGEVVKQLFRYKLPEVTRETDRRIVTFSRQPDQDITKGAKPVEKPLIRPPIKARTAPRPGNPEQKKLSLEHLKVSETAPPQSLPRTEPTPRPKEISKEILLSRFLSLVVDVVIALAAGFLFSFTAAQILGTPFPSPSLVQLAAICAVGFYFLNSVFFLATSGQTPGMIWTELKVVTDAGQFPSIGSIVSRTLLLIPSAATLVGLLWAVFDPHCRCWHDHLSHTRIVPAYLS